ncbi:nicotinate-nucleotide-dimethylbenzimidazole phosphoribosyltransferase [Halorubrum aquaticum]|uniref:Nicotinate-nucleotide--dimethylbenzimidazole phosphoribosyltransferase n=1 Tax=Halorubrum aquaticum TaxID=387340 RepID=A0A1I3BG70_9EURY|nr:nicotinate-nucleotide--dimethylbenzimidazole phosphoribosyltransferase [Halorubrum aquaticum]SFH61278.1 nicotinate-nucleotide-dimethylbenzimidazole phosphoribosyltransferase [Halorubrum aquaticum]
MTVPDDDPARSLDRSPPPDFSPPPIPAFDADAADAARERQAELTKPPGSLGRLEDLAVALAGLTGEPRPALANPTVVVAAADHGVVERGVSAYPQAVTRTMLRNFVAGGAAVSAISEVVGADTLVVDAGVEGAPVEVEGPVDEAVDEAADARASEVVDERVGSGTDDIAAGPAMARSEAVAALEAGVRTARTRLAEAGIVALGEMGIGNTTVAAALTSAIAGADPDRVTGPGTGVDEETRAHKVRVVERALARNGLDGSGEPDDGDGPDPVEVLRRVGGYEVGFLAGVALGCAADRTPVVVDGVVSGAAALVADALADDVRPYLLPSHAGSEPGHAVQLDALDLEPLFDHGLRLGEGSGAALALSTYRAACRTHDRMATFAEAGIER